MQVVKRVRVFGLIFQISQQEEIAHGCPNLGEYCVLAGPQKSLDLEVLLDPLKECLDLPAGLINIGDMSNELHTNVLRKSKEAG